MIHILVYGKSWVDVSRHTPVINFHQFSFHSSKFSFLKDTKYEKNLSSQLNLIIHKPFNYQTRQLCKPLHDCYGVIDGTYTEEEFVTL